MNFTYVLFILASIGGRKTQMIILETFCSLRDTNYCLIKTVVGSEKMELRSY